MSQWTPGAMPDQSGRTVVVTGANSGIGYEATKLFARAGAHVVMACRSEDRGTEARRDIERDVRDASLSVEQCDLADLSSVAAFTEQFAATYDDLHVLCNNAGIMAIPRRETADDFEMQFGVNHLGHFALTAHLLDELAATDGETRVVTQSSGLHENGEMDFSDLMGESDYDKWDAYAQSKLANLLFAYELDRRLEETNHAVTSIGCHPGYAATNLQARGPEMMGSTARKLMMEAANAVFAQSAEKGAWPMVYAATDGRVSGRDYVGPGGFMNMRGRPTVQSSSRASRDEAAAERLWDVSKELTGVDYPL